MGCKHGAIEPVVDRDGAKSIAVLRHGFIEDVAEVGQQQRGHCQDPGTRSGQHLTRPQRSLPSPGRSRCPSRRAWRAPSASLLRWHPPSAGAAGQRQKHRRVAQGLPRLWPGAWLQEGSGWAEGEAEPWEEAESWEGGRWGCQEPGLALRRGPRAGRAAMVLTEQPPEGVLGQGSGRQRPPMGNQHGLWMGTAWEAPTVYPAAFPMSVCTHPGWKAMQRMPCSRYPMDWHLVSMFRAAWGRQHRDQVGMRRCSMGTRADPMAGQGRGKIFSLHSVWLYLAAAV